MHPQLFTTTRTALAALILPLLLLANASAALAEKRIALIIGNSAYEAISSLDNPKNDAELMREALEEVGFEVIVAHDAKIRDMRIAIRDFGRKLHAAGKDAVGLFYYAGHGVQALGANYLIPIGAQIENEADLSIEAMSTAQILSQMESAGNTLNLVILDACRNNPFRGKVRSATRGLSRINAASGTLVAFSAGPGEVAVDGTDRNSPYTAALAKHIRTPNLPVEQMFKRVRIAVEMETGGKQTPWEESSLSGDFYFAGRSVTVTETPQEKPEPQSKPDDSAFDLSFWNSVQNSTDVESYEAYLKAHPQGRFAPLAKLKIRQLKAKQQAAVTAAPTNKVTEPAASDPPVQQCDRLAGDPWDPARKAKFPNWKQLRADPQAGIKACREAVRTFPGVARFEYQLGFAFFTAKEHEAAADWYFKAANHNYGSALSTVGHLYRRGLGVERDYEKALHWIRKGIDLGDTGSLYALGLMYEDGNGVERDYVEAARWYRKAADARVILAMISLGFLYDEGKGVDRNPTEGARWIREAAKDGYHHAMYLTGLRYERGQGVFKDYSAAARWYRKASEEGHDQAAYKLGWLHLYGRGVERDEVAAARLLVDAARGGSDEAYRVLSNQSSYDPGRKFMMAVQKLLQLEGHYTGTINGKLNSATNAAIRKLAGKSKI